MHLGKGILVSMLVSLATIAIVTRVQPLRKLAGLE